MTIAEERAELQRFAAECKDRAKLSPPEKVRLEREKEADVTIVEYAPDTAPLVPKQYRSG